MVIGCDFRWERKGRLLARKRITVSSWYRLKNFLHLSFWPLGVALWQKKWSRAILFTPYLTVFCLYAFTLEACLKTPLILSYPEFLSVLVSDSPHLISLGGGGSSGIGIRSCIKKLCLCPNERGFNFLPVFSHACYHFPTCKDAEVREERRLEGETKQATQQKKKTAETRQIQAHAALWLPREASTSLCAAPHLFLPCYRLCGESWSHVVGQLSLTVPLLLTQKEPDLQKQRALPAAQLVAASAD